MVSSVGSALNFIVLFTLVKKKLTIHGYMSKYKDFAENEEI